MKVDRETLAGILISLRESDRGDRTITHILGQDEERQISYAELHDRAMHVLHHLQIRGIQPGSELLICTPSNEQFLDAFWACQLGGITAVPVAVGHSYEHRRKFFNIYEQLADGYVFSNRKTLEPMQAFAKSNGLSDRFSEIHARSVAADELTADLQQGTMHHSGPEDCALVQFSSGSTGSPKGVMLTSSNLIANVRGIIEAAHISQQDALLSWMPLYHDLGLVGCHLVPLILGVDQHFLPTELFARRPLLWMSKAGEKRATILSSPNFGFRRYLKSLKAKGAADLDLSHVRLVFNGAEPISASLCEEFSDALAPFGLRQNSIFPVYGLAEASLAVSFPEVDSAIQTLDVDRRSLTIRRKIEPGASARNQIRLVGVGTSVPGCELRVVDDDGLVVEEDVVGHIQIRGENVTRRYYGQRERREEHEWLDTGDLGILNDQLYVVGRSKETMILNGVTYHPHDLEKQCASLAEVDPEKVACVGVHAPEDGEESVLVFVIHRGPVEEFVPMLVAVRHVLGERAFIDPYRVIPVRSLPRTTSGKLQRYALRDAFLDGEFQDTLAALDAALAKATDSPKSEARTEVERTLLGICRSVITTEEVDPNDDLLDKGTSSLALAEICEAVEDRYPGVLELSEFFEHTSVSALAAHLEGKLKPPD